MSRAIGGTRLTCTEAEWRTAHPGWYWDPQAFDNRQRWYLSVWLIGFFPVGLLLLAQRPNGRWRRLSRQELAGAAYSNWGSADEEARGRLAAPEREAAEARDAELGKLATELRRIRASRPEEFELLPGCERARRFLAEYEASGPTAEAEALVRQAAREAAEALSALVADVPDVAHRDSRGEPWAPRLRPVDREAR